MSALNTHDSTSLNDSALQKNILKYTNDEYDHSESDIRFASSRLDFAVTELWIFAFLLKSENKISSVSDIQP